MGGWGGCLGGGQGSELAAAAGGGRRHCWVYCLLYLCTVDYLVTGASIDACLRSPTCDMRHANAKHETRNAKRMHIEHPWGLKADLEWDIIAKRVDYL